MSENCIDIIDALIKQRKAQGMTQQELANTASLTQSVIARFESKKSVPQLNTLLKITSALGCELIVSPTLK